MKNEELVKFVEAIDLELSIVKAVQQGIIHLLERQ